ncbi:DeoR/GlpR transcriptional regulator [Mesoplasma syrphidae]|uniref:DeoR/GlpR transcriptional regulator n=1 Tax=Mesoplasma syrphidae TaxID=225999 RepID=A0A2K9C2P8_9MOLU|nr:DeoR/GlpR family DNA-binding transcription regulator [Mesoplasma syrphidae]AUF83749.1 DeoR/GlpR transcriptional regulator [Mesoplasma syrphidae]
MIKEQRYELILKYLQGKSIISTNLIATDLKIPFTTLRRDLNHLHGIGKIYKMHGGVIATANPDIPQEYYIDEKIKLNIAAKKAIAKRAATLVKPNETIFMDGGSTVYYFAKQLDPKLNLKIVTSSAMNLQVLAEAGHKNISILGGTYDPFTGTIVGAEAVEQVLGYKIDKCFIGIDGYCDGKIYLLNLKFIKIKEALFAKSQVVYGLVDKSKFNFKTCYEFPNPKRIKIITN